MRNRRRLGEHGANLHGGGLRAHEAAAAERFAVEANAGREAVFLEVKGVLLVTRGVVGQRVERIEIEDFVFDVGAVGEREAEAAENLDGAVARLQHGMKRAGRLVTAGQRGIEVGRFGRGGQLGLAGVEGGRRFRPWPGWRPCRRWAFGRRAPWPCPRAAWASFRCAPGT